MVANVSAAFAGRLRLHPGTRALIASGYLESDRPEPEGFTPTARRISDGWAADLFLREE